MHTTGTEFIHRYAESFSSKTSLRMLSTHNFELQQKTVSAFFFIHIACDNSTDCGKLLEIIILNTIVDFLNSLHVHFLFDGISFLYGVLGTTVLFVKEKLSIYIIGCIILNLDQLSQTAELVKIYSDIVHQNIS